MPRGRGGHASQPGSARAPGGAPERERRREEERSGGHAQMRPCHQTRQNRPRIAPGSGYAVIWSRPRNAPRGHQAHPEGQEGTQGGQEDTAHAHGLPEAHRGHRKRGECSFLYQ